MKRQCFLRFLRLIVKALPISFWLVLLFAFDKPYIAILTLISALIHELGHVFALFKLSRGFRFFGVASGFRLTPESQLSYREELIAALSGPLANVAVFLLLLPFLLLGSYPYASLFGAVNLFTALSNLVPIEGYDGYRALCCFIDGRKGGRISSGVLKGISFTLTAVISLISLYLIRSFDGGYWIFFIFLASLVRAISNDTSLFSKKTG